MQLSASAKRSIRTLYQAILAMLTAVPLLLAILPDGSPLAVKYGSIVAAFAAVTAAVNKAEDAGLIPAWLKDEASLPE